MKYQQSEQELLGWEFTLKIDTPNQIFSRHLLYSIYKQTSQIRVTNSMQFRFETFLAFEVVDGQQDGILPMKSSP